MSTNGTRSSAGSTASAASRCSGIGAAIFQVTLEPDGASFDCAADEPVLTAAHRANILMPYSCRGGQCGACRGRLLHGEIAYPHGTPPALAPGDVVAGYALFCSARPLSDLVIERAPAGF